MNAVTIATSVLTLVAGVGVFLIACTMLSANLESLGSGKLKKLFAKTSKSKLLGVGVGTAATVAIQSSSATTVMVIGFVNAGIMTLAQAATVIFGANIGTTITGQLVALGLTGGSSLSVSVVFAALAGVGAFTLAFAKNERIRQVGGILAGFGMLFVGLSVMSGAMKHFSDSDSVKNFLAAFRNPFLLVLIGTVLTAVVQSSSVMTSMTITMVVTGLISLNQGIYITMGSNVGTCITALIAGLTSTKNAKRTALIHLIFNVSGVVLFMLTGLFLRMGGINFEYVLGKIFPHVPQMQLAMFHTVFNVVTVLAVLPLTNLLVKLVTKIIPDKKNATAESDEPRLHFVDEYMLKTPPLAVQQTKNEIMRMASLSMENVNLACNVICNLDYEKTDVFRANEIQLNYYHKELVKFIVKLLKCELNEKDRIYLSTAIRSITDLERVGDYAENIIEYADKLKEAEKTFSVDAVAEINGLKELLNSLYEKTESAYKNCDRKMLKRAYEIEERVDAVTAEMGESHIKRLSDGVCTPEVGAQYLALSINMERIADHYINVAKTIKAYS
ncbi:Na/Pi cotransporter family protein [Pumilibacter muris]|uniref:Na/Pi cotransporter family protein n=1 Tax=Pumilibacter muris TaxID=2941510 RepID=UPI00203A7A56|nr:Na/Pi cotransporter family protein [Pumilibacter muris]